MRTLQENVKANMDATYYTHQSYILFSDHSLQYIVIPRMIVHSCGIASGEAPAA